MFILMFYISKNLPQSWTIVVEATAMSEAPRATRSTVECVILEMCGSVCAEATVAHALNSVEIRPHENAGTC